MNYFKTFHVLVDSVLVLFVGKELSAKIGCMSVQFFSNHHRIIFCNKINKRRCQTKIAIQAISVLFNCGKMRCYQFKRRSGLISPQTYKQTYGKPVPSP